MSPTEAHLTTYCATLREALGELLDALTYAEQDLPYGQAFLREARAMAARVLRLDQAGLHAYHEQQIQIELARLAYLFADEISWVVHDQARRAWLGRPTPAELADGLAELEGLTVASLALNQEEPHD